MNTRFATIVVIGALILPAAGYAADIKSMKESVKENVGDAVITSKIKAEFAKDKLVRARNIKVDTDDKGVVTLSGKARSNAEADKAVKIARDTKGVSSVRNDIQIIPAATAAAGDQKPDKNRTVEKRRSDQPVDDTWITTKVKARFVENKQVSATDIHVKTVNGVVELTGSAKSMDESSKAASLARGIQGVKSVTNNIKVN